MSKVIDYTEFTIPAGVSKKGTPYESFKIITGDELTESDATAILGSPAQARFNAATGAREWTCRKASGVAKQYTRQ